MIAIIKGVMVHKSSGLHVSLFWTHGSAGFLAVYAFKKAFENAAVKLWYGLPYFSITVAKYFTLVFPDGRL